MKKILFMLATQKGYDVLERICSGSFRDHVGCVISFHETGVEKDWWPDIRTLAESNNVPFHDWQEFKSASEAFIKDNGINGIIAVGWKYLIPLELNDILEDPVIIFHDSLLPKYRGFAPVVTAMLFGEKRIGASAIIAGDTPDNGDIICQGSMELNGNEYIADVISEMSKIYADLCETVVKDIVEGCLKSTPQNEDEATYSVWRDEQDYRIDWNKSADEIARMVRALGSPYMGASTTYEGATIRILRASVVAYDLDFAIRDTGKIWALNNGHPIVICGKGLIEIEYARDEQGDPCDFKRLRRRFV